MNIATRNLFLITFCSIAITACTSITTNKISQLNERFAVPRQGVMVIAHRACWRLAPENTPLSIQKCIEIGTDMVEIDVRRTKDGHLVLMHDESVDRTTNGIGLVKDLTLKQIKILRLKEFDGGDGAKLTDLQIPTLKEALLAAKDRVLVNLDAKGQIREQAYQEAKELDMLDHILIKTVMTQPTQALRSATYYKKTHFMPIVREKDADLGGIVDSFNKEPQQAYEVIFKTETGLDQACAKAYAQGARCWVNTLWEDLSPGYSDDRNVTEPDKHWGVLIKKFGVDMIQTDRPQLLIKYLKNNELYKA